MSWLSSFFGSLFGRHDDEQAQETTSEPMGDEATFRLFGPGRPSCQDPPAAKGEYRFVNTDTGEIGYVGQTNNLKRRKREHERARPDVAATHRFEWKQAHDKATSADLKDHERKKIKKKKPPLNRRAGGGGPNAAG